MMRCWCGDDNGDNDDDGDDDDVDGHTDVSDLLPTSAAS